MRTCEEHGRGVVVVFDASRCPVCDELRDKDDKIEKLEETVSRLDLD